ncbi:MAG: hypothetical protein UY50_C0024G0043 [Parcubacteria group bacterium GW2011_GWA2_49_9]|nr:MAG: hypothetical protein UY50_C0024G0043 [Parcubacteria group bacterium GW2011_GWA2_49_9]
METFIKADIFFFITSIAVILITVGVIVILYYLIKILKNVTSISDRIEEGSRALEEDFTTLRQKVKSGEIAMRIARAVLERTSAWMSGTAPKRKGRTKASQQSDETHG